MLEDAVRKRAEHAKANGETKEAWKEAWRLYPDPTETHYNRARIAAAKNEATKWIAEALNAPLTRATRNFALAVQASRGKTQSGGKRSGKAGHVQPRSRRDDSRAGLEWQLQGKAALGGVPLANVTASNVVHVPVLGAIRFADKATLLNAYIAAGAEACELTMKRDGAHYYACIAVRGLQPLPEHPNMGTVIGIDMGVTNPLSLSNGCHVTEHQGHDIAAHLERLERKRLRIERQRSRKFYVAAELAGALTDTGAIKKSIRIETSNRMRRLNERARKIERQMIGYRADWQRCQALQIARESQTIVVEALRVQKMTASAAGSAEKPGENVRAKSGLNKAILSRGWGSMRQRLKSKAEEFGGRAIEVDPAFTSQSCPACGVIDADNRKTQAEFSCVACGHSEHADIIGAKNILARGLSPGALPGAGRGGFANRATDEASNKSMREL